MTTPISIIVVDDEPGLRAMVLDYLTTQGFVVDEAESGAALDKALSAKRPDLILLDVNMPGKTGSPSFDACGNRPSVWASSCSRQTRMRPAR